MKKLISLVLALILALSVFTIVPMSAFAEEIDPNKVYVKVNNQHYEVNKGDIFTYTFYVAYEDAKISSLDVHISYDSKGLKFVPTLDEYGDEDYVAMFPVLKDSVIANFANDGVILFNYSKVNGKKLTGDNTTIFCGDFEVTADSGVYEIDGYVHTLADTSMNKIVFKGEKIQEYEEKQELPELIPIEEETEVPTEEPTQEPTDAPTEEPTQPTDEPTVEPTEAPTLNEADITVYLVNYAEWTNVLAFAYLDTTEYISAMWPGDFMTLVGYTADGVEVYSISYEYAYDYILFNFGGENYPDAVVIKNNWFYDNERNEWIEDVDFTEIEPTEPPTEEPTQEPTDPPYDYTTVYLINSAEWTHQNIYLWNEGDNIAVWPGLAMTYTGEVAANGAAIFKFTYNKYYANVIFNNGVNGTQTADLQVYNDWYYDNLSEQWLKSPDDVVVPTEEPTEIPTEEPTEEPTEIPTEEPTEEPTEIPTEEPTEEPTEIPTEEPTEEPTEIPTEEPTEEPTEIPTEEPTEEPTENPTEEPTEEPSEITVYLIDEAGWGFSHVYAWSGTEQHAAWPGATMTFVGTAHNGNQMFSFTFPKAYENIIFNNGVDGIQTDDLEFRAGGIFNNKTMEWEMTPGNDTDPTEEPTEKPTEVPTDPIEPPTELPTINPGDNPDKVFGDVDGDGETKVFDATLIQRYIAKSSELTEEQKLVADIDGDGEIKVFDATLLQRYVAKLE